MFGGSRGLMSEVSVPFGARLAHTAALLAAITTLAAPARSTRGLDGTLPVTAVPASQRVLHVLIVARAQDCDSRLSFAHVFQRTRRMQFEGLVVLDHDGAPMTQPVNLDELRTVVTPPGSGYRSLLGSDLGASPLLLVYDEQRVLHMIIQAPVTTESAETLSRWIIRGAT
jgi:hypothetical protein